MSRRDREEAAKLRMVRTAALLARVSAKLGEISGEWEARGHTLPEAAMSKALAALEDFGREASEIRRS